MRIQSSSQEVVIPSAPEESQRADNVTAVIRALGLMEVFEMGESTLSLAELTRRSGMHKTTALRLIRTLAATNYMVQTEDGQWRLGPATSWLGAKYQSGFDVNRVVNPTLHELVNKTGESASFYVREGSIRTCISRVEGPKSVRHNVRVGEPLPLEKGASGRVILAFSGGEGRIYEGIRQQGFHISMGEREAEVSSVAAPVFSTGWRLLGAVCISGPSSRLTKEKLGKHAKTVTRVANQLSYSLAGARSLATPTALSSWHP
ncbi:MULTISPECIES: IclR family transcriptional regulator [unclassified Acidovorax]|uniref:IclR family transcriptional regulator n=1 Tax=unclassified Acidovorax TaxID=2684926 RepID=UPI001C48C198|nr:MULTISPECIES: IclR family transcriptional regulator [unclassified Acidovorax]MBV7429387.1 IclR family transcriptional regulator [Acidovorax sp. sif0732]MBV7451213.1 IclR family transcriptional regulator [Acidovorax sp. sif0715]